MDIESVLRNYEEHLMQLPNVTGTGIGEKKGKEVILVFVKRKVPESELPSEQVIPKSLEGFETDVITQIIVYNTNDP
jgi:hypothetical protein